MGTLMEQLITILVWVRRAAWAALILALALVVIFPGLALLWAAAAVGAGCVISRTTLR